MKVFTYCILLFVVIGLVPVATAFVPIHSLSGTPDGTDDTLFVYGGTVFDTIIPTLGSMEMNFMWVDPSMGTPRSADIALGSSSTYHDFLYSTDEEGMWTVVATETKYNGAISEEGIETFNVAALPEFSLGSFISLAFAGILYFLMRRTVKGSVNVG